MNKLIVAVLSLTAASGAAAQSPVSFQRPDCSAYANLPEGEGRCFRKARDTVRFANYAALQETGLEFAYLARPPADLAGYPEARKAVEEKAEGEFLITFSVDTEGKAHDVKVVSASSEPIDALARVWADTIAQWRFTKVASPVADIPFRRVYLYSSDDEERGENVRG